MSWQQELDNIMGGYFLNWSVKEGVSQLVFVSEANPEYHHRYVETLETAIKAAESGDDEVVAIIKKSAFVRDLKEAIAFLDEIATEYQAQYMAAMAAVSRREAA